MCFIYKKSKCQVKESVDHNYQQILGYKDAFNQKQSRNGLNKKELWLPTLLENATANIPRGQKL